MPVRDGAARRGRRGRRTSAMIRIAQERIADLFALAELEARGGGNALPDRYVGLARRIGMRYNVRLLREYRHLYCRACSTFWVEGRTVRTRLRRGRSVRTCLRCGSTRRTLVRSGPVAAPLRDAAPIRPASEAAVALANLDDEADPLDADGSEGA